jgi:hypothetical protein
MILRALTFDGWLDISAPEVLGSTEFEWLGAAAQFRRSMRTGDVVNVPDEYYRFPNIKNAVDAGMLEIVAYDARPEQIVIHAEVTGGTGTPGTRYVAFDIHGGADTAIIRDVNGVPSLVFDDGCDYVSKWNVQVPEDYVAGTAAYIEAFWSFASGAPADVRWEMEYKIIAEGADVTGPVSSVAHVQSAPVDAKLYTTGTNLVISPSNMSPGRFLMASVSRTATNPLDTLSATVYIHLVRLSYTGKVFSS